MGGTAIICMSPGDDEKFIVAFDGGPEEPSKTLTGTPEEIAAFMETYMLNAVKENRTKMLLQSGRTMTSKGKDKIC